MMCELQAPESIQNTFGTYHARDSVSKYAYLISVAEIQERDYNLNIPHYVDTFEEAEIDLMAVRTERLALEAELSKLGTEMKGYLGELGYDS